ncbi:MAG: GntR family transcriptional regulator [Pedobacter sp.]|nr:GntR family transcriptional regulator [Pedobacter sp.]
MIRKETTPLYKKVIDDLKMSIDDSKYKKGDLLPSENDLCKTYNTTRATIRQALSGLINMGYITRKHGKGSIVIEPKKGLGILSFAGVSAGIGDQSLSTQILQKQTKQRWPLDFFYELNEIELQKGCIYFRRLRQIDNIPVLYEETYITNINLPRFVGKTLQNVSLFKTIKELYNIEIATGEQKIWAVNGDKQVSKLLNIKASEPLVHMKRRLQTNIKDLNIYSSIYCNTQEYFLQDYF